MKYYLVQLGCQMNHSDGERIASVLEAMGYELANSEEEAQILGAVACSVRQKAIDRVYARINQWNKWKHQRNLLTFVSGCILPEDREKFLQRFDLIFSINELPQLPAMIAGYGVPSMLSLDSNRLESARALAEELGKLPAQGEPDRKESQELEPEAMPTQRPVGPLWLKDAPGMAIHAGPIGGEAHTAAHKLDQAKLVRYAGLAALKTMQAELKPSILPTIVAGAKSTDPMGGFWQISPSYRSTFEAAIPIQNGCDKFCTFCAVPYTRGREVSRPSQEILSELQGLVDRGYRSITLLGQNVNSYGKDKPGEEMGFSGLLSAIGQLGESSGKKFWVYFTSPHPRDMEADILHAMARWPVLAKQVHIPLQSGDDKLLLRMNRNHSMDRYRALVADVRRILPQASLFTDIIVGFSGESEEQFQNSLRAMEEFSYQMAFISPYSPRPGAASSRWPDDVSPEEKKRRFQVLTEVLHQTSRVYNESLLGTELLVLPHGLDKSGHYLDAYTEGKINLRFALPPGTDARDLLGTFVRVRVSKARNMSLEGEYVGLDLS